MTDQPLTLVQEIVTVARRGNFVILDTETTGLDRYAEICQIAIIDPQVNVLLDTLVKPVRSIPKDASRIHGITDANVSAAPGFMEIYPRILEIITDKDVIVYNSEYDYTMLERSAKAAGQRLFPPPAHSSDWYCLMNAFAEFYGDWSDYHESYTWKPLSTAARHCKVNIRDTHSALGDCRMALGVLRYLMENS